MKRRKTKWRGWVVRYEDGRVEDGFSGRKGSPPLVFATQQAASQYARHYWHRGATELLRATVTIEDEQ